MDKKQIDEAKLNCLDLEIIKNRADISKLTSEDQIEKNLYSELSVK